MKALLSISGAWSPLFSHFLISLFVFEEGQKKSWVRDGKVLARQARARVSLLQHGCSCLSLDAFGGCGSS